METLPGLRSFVRKLTPAPVKRFVRSALIWKRRAQFHAYKVTKTIEGESFPFLIGDATGKQWYEPDKDPVYRELAFIRDNMLSESDIAFDVGSHHGLHALVMARHSKRVLAIEPNPHNVAILRKNIVLNSLQNIVVRQAAVGDSVGKVALPQDSSQGGILLENRDSLPMISVDYIPLDHLADEHGFPQFLKIDVEGFEDRVLKGASRITRRRPKVMLEVHVDWVSRYGSSVREVVELLNLESYRVWVLPYPSEEIRPWSGDNLTEYPSPKFTLFLLPKPLEN